MFEPTHILTRGELNEPVVLINHRERAIFALVQFESGRKSWEEWENMTEIDKEQPKKKWYQSMREWLPLAGIVIKEMFKLIRK